jgi:uncharacterized membrane protein YphA (DoxX/SURF4 family)
MVHNRPGAVSLPRVGEFLVASLMAFSCVMHFKFAQYVAMIVPSWMPWRPFWAYFAAIAFLAAAISIVLHEQHRIAAVPLAVLLFSFVLLIHTPSMIHSIVAKPQDFQVLWSFNGTGGLNNALKDFTITVSVLLIGAPRIGNDGVTQPWTLTVLRGLFAIVVMLFGIEHFFFTNYTPGIPSCTFVSFWIPWRMFWGYFTGLILLATGGMILTGKRPQVAAITLGYLILMVTVLTYAFRTIAGLHNFGELTNMMKDVALAGGAFILSGTYPPAARKFARQAKTAECIELDCA